MLFYPETPSSMAHRLFFSMFALYLSYPLRNPRHATELIMFTNVKKLLLSRFLILVMEIRADITLSGQNQKNRRIFSENPKKCQSKRTKPDFYYKFNDHKSCSGQNRISKSVL